MTFTFGVFYFDYFKNYSYLCTLIHAISETTAVVGAKYEKPSNSTQ